MKNILLSMFYNNKRENGVSLLGSIFAIVTFSIIGGVIISESTEASSVIDKAEFAITETDIAAAKENAEMMSAAYTMEFYEIKYIKDGQVPNNAGIYVVEQLNSGKKSGDYFIDTTEDGMINVYKKEKADDKKIASGMIEESGGISW